MKIGFDISQTGTAKAGCGCFADSLIRQLAEIDHKNEYLLYPTFGDVYWDEKGPSATTHINRKNFQRYSSHDRLAAAQQFWRNPGCDFETQLGSPDIVHSNNYFCPRGLRHARLVYTLHDLTFLEHPEFTTEANRLACFEGALGASLRADSIIAVSHYSRRHFLETFPHFPVDRIVVIHEASRFSRQENQPRPVRFSHLTPGKFWLNVGTIEPRKNQHRLLHAYAQLKVRGPNDFPLVLAGGKGWLMDDFESAINTLGLQQNVQLLGYVGDQELQWLYQNCFAFLYPSISEGFGLPVLEAMSLGAPVITSDNTSLPEIVGSTGLLVDPGNEESIASAMQMLVSGQVDRELLRRRALEKASTFSWRATAEQVLATYERVMSLPAWHEQPEHRLATENAAR